MFINGVLICLSDWERCILEQIIVNMNTHSMQCEITSAELTGRILLDTILDLNQNITLSMGDIITLWVGNVSEFNNLYQFKMKVIKPVLDLLKPNTSVYPRQTWEV